MRDLIRIDDPHDPRIAGFRDIRERDLVGRAGLFVAEGKVVLNVLLRSHGFEPVSLLVLENRIAGIADLLGLVPADVPVHVVTAAVMDGIAGFAMHRGILALARRSVTPTIGSVIADMPPRALLVVAVGISNHDNIGSIFRNAAAFGADAVLLDATCCDPLYRKAIRVSVGGVFRVPHAGGADASDLVDLLLREGFVPVALSPRGATDVSQLERPARVALFLGTEGDGLPARLLDAMRTVRIAMAPGFDSLNVAAASAIALHRLSDAGRSG